MFDIVKKAIDEFNTYGLLPEAPNDKFDSESRKIAGQITKKNTIEEIAEIIAIVLSKAFDANFDAPKCMVPAEKIYRSIR